MTSLIVRLLTSVALLMVVSQAAHAQPPVSVSVAAGEARNGSSAGMEAMMGAAGLAGSASNLFSSGSTRYPISDSALMWRGADIRVRIRPQLSVGVFFSKSDVTARCR